MKEKTMAKKTKKFSAEERKEFKGGKYMGGPAEEKAEKKKPSKRMAMGGMPDRDGTARYGKGNMSVAEERGMKQPRRNIQQQAPSRPLPGRPRPPVAKPPVIEQPPLPPYNGGNGATNYPGVERPENTQTVAPPLGPLGSARLSGSQGPGAVSQQAALASLNNQAQMQGSSLPTSPLGSGLRAMRGGGLAKKGVGQAMAKGGLVKGCGCASRGVKNTKYR